MSNPTTTGEKWEHCPTCGSLAPPTATGQHGSDGMPPLRGPTTGEKLPAETYPGVVEQAVNDFIRHHHNPIVAQLNQQLAAERESHEKELDVVEANWSAEVQQLREQLDAEREKLNRASNNFCTLEQSNQQLRERLATAVKALKEIRRTLLVGLPANPIELIDASLARIGGK